MATLITDKKPLGLWTLTALVVGNMIGSGIFLLPADLAKLGRAHLLAWGVTSLGAFFIAAMLSRLSQLVPQSGGPFTYARQGLGRFVGFQSAYNHWIAIWVGNLGLVLALIGYLAMFWPVLLRPGLGIGVGITVIWLITWINTTGIRPTGILQLITVILKLIPILLVAIGGMWYFHPAYLNEALNVVDQDPHTITAAASLTLWAFIGIESATIPYNFIENPQKNIPLATMMGTIIAAIVYILSSTVIMGVLPQHLIVSSVSPFILAAEMMFGVWGKWFMIAGAIISCVGCLNGWTMLQGQIAMVAADNNLFPGIFSMRNKKGIPAAGLIITAILESLILLLTLNKEMNAQFQLITLMAALAALIPYLYSSLAALTILKRQTALASIKDKILFLIASISAVYSFWLITISGEKVIFYGAILVFISALLYCWGYGEEKEKR